MGDMSQIEAKLISGNMFQVPGQCVFRMERSSAQICLTFPDGTKFAFLNSHAAKVLGNVIDLPSVQLEALVYLSLLRETIGGATKSSDATLRVNINAYGSNETRKDVGRHLAAGKMYLQHPDQQRPGSVYDNPHVLAFPGMQVPSVDFKLLEIDETLLQPTDADQFQKTVSDVYVSLKRSSRLKPLVGDARVRTSLLP